MAPLSSPSSHGSVDLSPALVRHKIVLATGGKSNLLPLFLKASQQIRLVMMPLQFNLSNESNNDEALPPPLKRRRGPNLNALSKSVSRASADDEELASQVSMHNYDPTPTHKNVHDLCTGLRHDKMAKINDSKDSLLVCLCLKDERKQKNQKMTGDKITAWVAMVKSGLM
ncbi:hypothetical protein BS47DRAFT_1369161 [Hydnum rufescens UP504]|uniref:Uncharacterized protein n=1 Tax=Hydnum rufescens UP504 TaxID=1448309 RepID=A0A9P6DG43_9AGAM|nr:hypothetical protein BS47DRAFT_1369161 [Hydnum rufescens UP504]